MPDEQAILGIQMEKFPPAPGEPVKYFLMITTATRMYPYLCRHALLFFSSSSSSW
jgi:hypothetical protein